jgi:hypothetical protein
MKKASNRGVTAKLAQKRPTQKKPATKQAQPQKAQGGAGLAEVVALLSVSAEKLVQAADRLAEATTRLSVTEPARHERLDTPVKPPADSTTSQSESEAAAPAEGEQSSTEQMHEAGQGGAPTTNP